MASTKIISNVRGRENFLHFLHSSEVGKIVGKVETAQIWVPEDQGSNTTSDVTYLCELVEQVTSPWISVSTSEKWTGGKKGRKKKGRTCWPQRSLLALELIS